MSFATTRTVAAAAAMACLLWPDATRADDGSWSVPTPGGPRSDVALMGFVGLMTYTDEGGGYLAQLSLLYRWGVLGVGGFVESGGFLLGLVSGGARAGIAFRADGGFRAELLGTGGVRHYEGWGRSLFGEDPGGSATLPFVGFCGRLGYVFGPSQRGHFDLGFLLAVDQDVGHAQYTYFDAYAGERSEPRSIGGSRAALGLTLGATIDLVR